MIPDDSIPMGIDQDLDGVDAVESASHSDILDDEDELVLEPAVDEDAEPIEEGGADESADEGFGFGDPSD